MKWQRRNTSTLISSLYPIKIPALTALILGLAFSGLVKAEMTDINGEKYETVRIGKQEWAVENLRVENFRNGDTIPMAVADDVWQEITSKDDGPAFTPPPKDAEHGDKFGYYYNGYAASDDRGLCPDGWRIPKKEDVSELVNSVDRVPDLFATSVWKGKLPKYDHNPPTNNSGFTALPTGYRNYDGSYNSVQLAEHNTNIEKSESGYFWTSDTYAGSLHYAKFSYSDTFGASLFMHESTGMPVRCMRDL